ncbi:UNVERIFIED_CONTAM: hypothetical protein Slati_4276800 [Sesamum latifolium]|uniref:Retrotransposon gag domain-containing protein n=1 Tax=Sesamum latifolium TaxID=2727402 RepID=A0AAW2TDE6_9LAMI
MTQAIWISPTNPCISGCINWRHLWEHRAYTRERIMETPSNAPNKQKAREAPAAATTQALQVVPSASLNSLSEMTRTATPMSIDPTADTPRITATQDAPPMELSPTLLGTLQQMITSAIREQLTVLVPAQVTTQPEVVVLEQTDPTLAISRLDAAEGPAKQLPTQAGDVPPQWLAHLESLQKGLQDVQYQMMGAPAEEQADIPFTEEVIVDELPVNCRTSAIVEYDGTIDSQEHLSRFENAALLHRYTDDIKCRVFVTTFACATQQWFNQLLPAVIGSFREFRSLFLHQFSSSKHGKTELSLFSIRQKEGELLKDYLQRFNKVALEVPSATQEVKASAFVQGLMDGDFFKSLAKKLATKFDILLARAVKCINMEDA